MHWSRCNFSTFLEQTTPARRCWSCESAIQNRNAFRTSKDEVRAAWWRYLL